MAIVQVMDLFDEPMKILMLARHFGGAYVEEQERANKLQATLDMMSEPNACRRQSSPETIWALKAKSGRSPALSLL